MSFRNTTLARIMQMGDKIMAEPSSNPDLAGFNLLTKIMVKLVKALPKGPLARKFCPDGSTLGCSPRYVQ
jgi:hypothetical protein